MLCICTEGLKKDFFKMCNFIHIATKHTWLHPTGFQVTRFGCSSNKFLLRTSIDSLWGLGNNTAYNLSV